MPSQNPAPTSGVYLPPKLLAILSTMPRVAIAFSGGLDSRFLCHVARLAGVDIIAVHARGPHIASGDSDAACHWAQAHGISLREINIDPLDLPEIRNNDRQRCYACKKAMLASLMSLTQADSRAGRVICDGTNADDTQLFRPGNRAVAEAGARSPLAEAGLGKSQIRQLARETGLDFPEQKARPCLLTRLAYGLNPDHATLTALAQAENEIATILPGAVDFRLRLLPAPVLHLSSPAPDLHSQLATILAKHGFAEAEIETRSPLSGFFDRPDNWPPVSTPLARRACQANSGLKIKKGL